MWNDFFHVAKAFFCFLEHYGDKIRRPRKVEQDTAEALQTEEGMTTNAEGERKVKLWYNDVFRPASNLSEAINKSQACNATMNHLGLKRFSDAKTELGKLGFNLDAVTNKKRYVSFKFDKAFVPIALREETSGAAASSSAAAMQQ